MMIEQFLMEHGPLIAYIILFFAALIEGESIVLAAGYFAYKGYLSLPLIMVISFTATVCADQACFFIGRAYGPQLLSKYPKIAEKSHRIFELLHKYNTAFILGFRFIYGIRNVSPLVIGASGMNPKRFIILNLIAAFIWATISCYAGYLIGQFFSGAIETGIKNVIRYQGWFVGSILVLIGIFAAYKYYKRRVKK
jgi:membrane protein DedA with SNARE-associated domain